MRVLNAKMAVTFNGAAIIFACASQSGANAWRCIAGSRAGA
jgi:hypothetical protein